MFSGGRAQNHEIGAGLRKAALPIGEDLIWAQSKSLYRALHARGFFIADPNQVHVRMVEGELQVVAHVHVRKVDSCDAVVGAHSALSERDCH